MVAAFIATWCRKLKAGLLRPVGGTPRSSVLLVVPPTRWVSLSPSVFRRPRCLAVDLAEGAASRGNNRIPITAGWWIALENE